MNTQKRNLCAAGVLLTAAATMVVLFLFRLSQPDKAQQSIFLNCTASDRGGWTFYTEAGQPNLCSVLVATSTAYRRKAPVLL